METKLVLTEYEKDALATALKKHISNLDDQIKEIKKSKHSSSATKKEIQRRLTKNINLLKDILNKFN